VNSDFFVRAVMDAQDADVGVVENKFVVIWECGDGILRGGGCREQGGEDEGAKQVLHADRVRGLDRVVERRSV